METFPADAYIQIASVFFSTFLAVYTYRLARFFKNGIFYRSYKLMWPAWVFYAVGSFVDVFPELDLAPSWFHIFHAVTYAIFFILISLSIYRFYNGWKEMGMKHV
jgi:hypothetical protein